ncbi:MAG: Hpt domain-containing protein, partial [Planctomycetaceae bacterium]|nr:Hpt domain-containing protein [Planctomycetaceae bacterium]
MSDAANPNQLDEILALRARCVEFSERSVEIHDPDLTEASSTLVDLLSVAGVFCDEDPASSRALEILEFVENTALPALIPTGPGLPAADVQREVEITWGECLDLLEPTEKFRPTVTDEWAADEISGQQPPEPDMPLSAFDIGGILTALQGAPEEADGESSPSVRASDEASATPVMDVQAAVAALTSAAPASPEHSPASRAATAPSLPAGGLEPETIDDPEMVAAYGDDAQLCLAEMEASVLGIESGSDVTEGLRNFCRQLHTLKGASGTVGLTKLAAYLHDLESFVEA